MQRQEIFQRVAQKLSEHFGIPLADLTPETDLVEDIDIKSDLEAMTQFVHSLNDTFEIELRLQNVAKELEDGTLSMLGDIVDLVEDALLE